MSGRDGVPGGPSSMDSSSAEMSGRNGVPGGPSSMDSSSSAGIRVRRPRTVSLSAAPPRSSTV
eukprot:3842061-Prymnesium_polylepis.1